MIGLNIAQFTLSGFGFPFVTLLPAHIIGTISLVLLLVVAFALYGKRLAGPWRRVWITGSAVLLYFNVFVLMAQLFRKIPVLLALAPTQKEAPFAITQLIVLGLFATLSGAAIKGFKVSA